MKKILCIISIFLSVLFCSCINYDTPESIRITRPDLLIYEGPGYDYRDTGTLIDIGAYTITEKILCDEGITWGKLKSGLGWIDLDKAKTKAGHIPVTLEQIGRDSFDEKDYHVCIFEETDYTRYLLIQPYEELTELSISLMDFTDDGFQPGEPIYTLEKITEDKPLVIGVVFYGDFTTFSLSFDDKEGENRQYMIYTSGRNGSVVLQEKEVQNER